jgi:nitroreductase
MDLDRTIRTRQSVRRYRDQPVEREMLHALIEAVRLAPSACNSQPWKLILVDNPELKNQVAAATFSQAVSFNRFSLEAPVIALLTVEKPKWTARLGSLIKQREFPLIDVGIAAAHFCLKATELGLGTCMLGWFDEHRICRLLNIPRQTRIGLLITLGHAEQGYPLRKKIRKEAAEMSGFNDYRSATGDNPAL